MSRSGVDVIYDADCALCRRVLRLVQTVDLTRALRFHASSDVDSVARLAPELSQADLDEAMYALDGRGRRQRGTTDGDTSADMAEHGHSTRRYRPASVANEQVRRRGAGRICVRERDGRGKENCYQCRIPRRIGLGSRHVEYQASGASGTDAGAPG